MRAMILAAGKGTRMQPLTNETPKPLIPVNGKPLIGYTLMKLADAGFTEVIINVSVHAQRFILELGHGEQFGVNIKYSFEEEPLETGGGIYNALPYLGLDPFLVINSDIWTDYDLSKLPQDLGSDLAHLVLVDNPTHHPDGDFSLSEQRISNGSAKRLTFSGIGIYSPILFVDPPGKIFPLVELLQPAIEQGQVSGECYSGYWQDVGTPQRLEELIQHLSPKSS